ncbi:MAG: hypothetical protein VB066_07860 [Paludibacter sp.]|nr:hypothetical protein [Paludibacter sp.]
MKQTKKKIMMAAALLLIGFVSLTAQETLLAKYDFTTKSKVPVVQVPGVVFGSEFGSWNTTTFPSTEMTITEDGYLLVRSYGTGVANTRYGYISITPAEGKIIRINRVVVKHFKTPGSNTNRTRSYLYDMGGAVPKDNPTINSNLIYTGNGGAVIPEALTEQSFTPSAAVEFNSIKFMSFSATQNTNSTDDLSQWKIEALSFYGEVLSPGDIVATGSINFGNVLAGNEVDGSVSLKVIGGTSENVNVELIDPTSSFSCLQTSVDAVDATAGTTVRVTYVPTVPGKHSAQLKFTYGDRVAYTNLSGVCPVLNENFTYFVSDPVLQKDMDSTKVNTYNQPDYLTMPGWNFNDSVYWHLSGSYALGLELRGNNALVPKAITPELNLSAPFGLTFRSKKMSNRTTMLGNMYVLADADTIWSFVNPNNTLTLRTIDGFVATANSKITFAGLANDSSRIAVDEISVFPTTTPALNLPAYMSKPFQSSAEPVTLSIPFKAYQLTTDIQVVFSGTPAGYEVLTPTIDKATAEAGTNIQVKYTKPAEGAEVSAVVEVKGGGLTDYRYISLINSAATGLSANALKANIFGRTGTIMVVVDDPALVEVFSFDGKMISRQQLTGNTEIGMEKGLYLVRLTNGAGCKVEKVFVR